MSSTHRRTFPTLGRALGVAILVLLAVACATAAAEPGPVNPDFEEGELGKLPPGWSLMKPSVEAGYTAELTDDRPKKGKRCVLLTRGAKAEGVFPGLLTQSLDAASFRGKRIAFQAAGRAQVAAPRERALLMMRIVREGKKPAFYDTRPITKADWTALEIVGDAPDDAETIEVALMLQGGGKAWIDAVSVEVRGKAGEGNEPARALEGRGLDNLVAFTRLFGYVRYFHPSDEAAAADWDSLAIDGVVRVEGAKSPAELAAVLEELFQPIAPTVQLVPTDRPAAAPKAEPPKADGPLKVLAWRHFGVRPGTERSNYSSERVDKPAQGKGDKEPPLPKPDEPFIAELGGGVSCRVPLALYADGKGTLPRATAKAPASAKPKGFLPSGNDRATRLAAVVIAWNVFQHFYPYFDVVKTDWPAELRKALIAAASDATALDFTDSLRRLVAALHDGHGRVSGVEDSWSWRYPSLRWDWIEDRLVVTRVAAEGAAGLKPGDVIARVNDVPAAEALAAKEHLISGATPQYRRHWALQELSRGLGDSEVALEIRSASGEARTVRVRRAIDAAQFSDLAPARPAKVDEVKPGVVYVDLDRVTDKDFEDAVPRLEKAKGIVFDMRGYPGRIGPTWIGHLTDEPVTSAQWRVPVAYYPDRQKTTFSFNNWSVQPKSPRFKARVAFLTDGRAISYAETCMGIIEHYKLAEIVGGPTAGTNGNVNPFTLPGGYRVVWTGMKVLKHDGKQHHGVGIQPTVPVTRTIKGVAAGRDEMLERGIEVVGR